MGFYVYGLSGHEAMPMSKLFYRHGPTETQPVAPEPVIDPMEHHDTSTGRRVPSRPGRERVYRRVAELPQVREVLTAAEIMTSPVVALTPDTRIRDALAVFHHRQFRHIPVLSETADLVGMISDRDILRHLGGIDEDYQASVPASRLSDPVGELMTTAVLTASLDTDVRYIARLFVERHVGALPVVESDTLQGIICRSDILRAVMRDFSLELWV